MKAYLAAVLEDLVGEYVLNISKENLKLAALRGKIKLENVELDGDYIGSHILGAVGLSGFGVLSCWARTLEINIPWTNLDAAPTSLEIRGMHLVCVPLLPTTANRMYYGSQTLRTRAKRSALARFERNFFAGRMAGEGPYQELYQNDGETLSYNGRRRRWDSSEDADEDDFFGDSIASNATSIEISLSSSINNASGRDASPSTKKEREAGLSSLKERLKAKIYANLVSSVSDVHIRCEIPEGGLNMSLPQKRDGTKKNRRDNSTSSNHQKSDQRAFAFGLTLKCLSVRNVSEDESPENEFKSDGIHRVVSSSSSISDGGSKTHKKVEIDDLTIYWDDDPHFLVSESDLLNGLLSLPVATCQRRIAGAMKQMSKKQDPGLDAMASLSKTPSKKYSPSRTKSSPDHDYICSTFSAQTMLTTIYSEASEDSLSFAEILPCRLDLFVTSQQYTQYQLLQSAVLSQQRFDTMLHRRPQKSPLDDPRSWWKYAIACVKHKPTSRSWKDIQSIVHCRKVYLELVVKNLMSDSKKGGYHGGLTDEESLTLLELEDLLPIETLLSFHLIALRRVYTERCDHKTKGKKLSRKASFVNSFAKKRSSSTLGRLLSSVAGSTSSWQVLQDEYPNGDEFPMFPSPLDNDDSLVMVKPKNNSSIIRAQAPTTQTTCQLHCCHVKIVLLESVTRRKIVTVEIDLALSTLTGSGKADLTFDITRFEVFDFVTHGQIASGGKVMAVEPDDQDFDCIGTVITDLPMENNPAESYHANSEIRLPPKGVVCRVTAMLDVRAVSLDLSAHPATLIWSKTCADSVANFFSSSTHQMQNHFLRQLRNAATPVAQRAQLAIFYPTSLSITVDVHAPKLWIPVSNQMLDGALFVDAGKLKMTLKKAEQSSETNWTADVVDIQIMLAGETSGTVLDGKETEAADLDGVSSLRKGLTTIVHPFQIDVTSHTIGSFEELLKMKPLHEVHSSNSFDTPPEAGASQISVKVGKIRLNLVDVEELAKAIGRFYSGMVLANNEVASAARSKSGGSSAVDLSRASHHSELSAFEIVHVCFEKLEMAVERYSSQRTYLVEVHRIKLDKKNKGHVSFSRLSISDFTIVQLADANQSSYSNIRYLKPSSEPQHQLLARKKVETNENSLNRSSTTPQTPTRRGGLQQTTLRTPTQLRLSFPHVTSSPRASPATEFMKGCHFHDGENNVDEVEFDVASAILKVTPTSISDCTMWLTRAIELIRIASNEMERRVHERGRKARTKEKKGDPYYPLSISGRSERIPASSPDDDMTSTVEDCISSCGKELDSRDSSIIFKVTFQSATILVGRPASEFACSRGRKPTDYVVQLITNASIMTQSIENSDGTGSRTVHISMQDLSASVNPDFQHVNTTDSWLLSPTAIDCRLVYDTVGEGHVSFQDFSFDCESMKWCLSPHDIRVVSSVIRKVAERLQLLQTSSDDKSVSSLSALVQSKKRGSRIATRIRADFHSCSFILIRSFKSKNGMNPFIEFNVSQLKANLEGCIDAMNGEVVTLVQVKFFNPKSAGWEDIIQPNRLIMAVEQIPNNLEFSISSPGMMNVNCTGSFIQEISNLERTNRHSNNSDSETKCATKHHNRFSLVNKTGLEVVIGHDAIDDRSLQLEFERDKGDVHLTVLPESTVSLDLFFTELHETSTLSLGAKDRQTIHKLPLYPTSTSKQCCLLYKWHQYSNDNSLISNGRDTESIEPVVEFVMQNQRLRPDVSDISSLGRGQDLLSSNAWSPAALVSERSSHDSKLWLSPYLKDDSYEWSDMTNIVKVNREDFALPDKNWMWVDDWWEIEVNADLGTNDIDGWEYATDFETFSLPPRSYRRGDLCRRRRWTKTRMLKHPQKRSSSIVWEVGTEENGSTIKARSHIQLHNHTGMKLTFFGFCHSWNMDEYIGNTAPEESICVPLQLSSATHIRLATPKKPDGPHSIPPKIGGFFATEQLMILPSGFTSSRIIHTSILFEHNIDGFLSIKKFHFLLTLKCRGGLIDIHVEPALKVINLLPCQLQCQLGEIGCTVRKGSRQISPTEVLSLSPGKDGKCLSVDCGLSPHVAVRLPGYKWSYWKKIVNRGSKSHTWRPTEEEEVALFEAFEDSAQYATEFKSIVHFDHKTSGGDPIDIVMSIEMGHSPILKFYAQYWILDKTGLGLNFTGGFSDLLATTPEALRKSQLLPTEANDRSLKLDMESEGHEWSLGMNGMTLFFSRDEKISLSIKGQEKSLWTSLVDVSKVMPETVKTAICIDQYHGTRRFELAYNITLCPSVFSRTRQITFFPRYQVVNLLGQESLYIAQDGALNSEICLSPQSYVHFHWEKSSLAPKVRLCSESGSWSRGCIQLDKIGVTAMRIPSSTDLKPMVVQAEVRLATKKQDSAVVVTIWESSIEKSNPLYLLKNFSRHKIFCRQKLSEEGSSSDDGFVWTLDSGESIGFGFDDPEMPHVLLWTWSAASRFISAVEVDAMGSRSTIALPDGSELAAEIRAEQSTKVILFSEGTSGIENPYLQKHDDDDKDDEIVALTLRIDLSGIAVSVIDSISVNAPGREILFFTTEGWHVKLSQSREGFHEMELRLKALQVDNFIYEAEHPILIYCPSNEDIPFLHLSVVRSIQEHSETLVFSYCALRITLIEICLDRKTAETIAYFLHPLRKAREEEQSDENWISALTLKMKTRYSRPNRLRDFEKNIHTANSGRIYLEKLHLHPIRLSLTFTQEGLEWNPVTEGLMIFQLIRGMASIADAPLIFTSLLVSHAFESPQTLLGIVSAHYSSQLSSQILTILGSLVILKAPADILSNVGTGIKDFFYEPINGLVQGPAEFLEGLESGTSSLARGVFTGLVRGTASVTELVSHNLANLTSDDVFIDERNAYHKKLINRVHNSASYPRTMQESLIVAGKCVAKGFQSGANGIFEQPSIYASRHGTAGLVKGVGKAFVGAIVKPVVGVGDAAVVVMNHVSETTSDKLLAIAKANKRLRRALPCASAESGNNVKLVPYDEKSAKVQQIVTGGETEDDAYLGHVQIPSHLIIASGQFLWIIDDDLSKPRRIRWAEISNFGIYGNSMKIDVFSGLGPRSFTFDLSSRELAILFELLSMKMGSSPYSTDLDLSLRGTSYSNLPGIKTIQVNHVFGSVNKHVQIEAIGPTQLNDEFIKRCYTRVNRMGSFMPNFFQLLDLEVWLLICSVGQMFTGLSSRRCIAVGIINGSGETIQVKTAKLVQGGSPCYTIPTIEYNKNQGVLHPGGAIVFFGWGAVPSLLQPGNVVISIETNIFVTDLADSLIQSTSTQVLPGWQVSFLEKSYDESGWWAKYWILVQKKKISTAI